ncbi:hypothetical protein FOL47_008649 [Perkinsus chesapeaki]|uniref:Ankyrin Repeat n=1 Tax=Perkinsus chesapeaki TaxID=330153 RepID=A0A7J6LCN0_PERCH|nr:hypothetical protein FOL47_008649 [Perkinsus chesapeaki]
MPFGKSKESSSTQDIFAIRGSTLTENFTRSLNLSLRTQQGLARSRKAESRYRGPQVVYDVTTKGARVNESKKAAFDVSVEKLRSLAGSKAAAGRNGKLHDDRWRESRRAFEESSLRFRQEVLKNQQYLYRIDKDHGSSEEERFRLKVWHGPVARNVSSRLKKAEKNELEARIQAEKEAYRAGRSIQSTRTSWIKQHPEYVGVDQLMLTRTAPSPVHGHSHTKTMGKLGSVRAFLETHSVYSDVRWRNPRALPMAGQEAYPSGAKRALQQKQQPTQQQQQQKARNNTPAHLAAAAGQAAVLEGMLQRPRAGGSNGRGQPQEAGGGGQPESILDVVNSDGATPLHLAIDTGSVPLIELLLQYRADVTIATNEGDTALNLATQKRQWLMAEVLLSYMGKSSTKGEPQSNKLTGDAVTPCRTVDLEAIRNATVDRPNAQGLRPIHYATWHGSRESVELLVESSADINAKDSHGNTALTIGACRGHLSVCQLLLSKGATRDPLNSQGNIRFTPLHLAAANGHTECIKALVEAGMDVNGVPGDRVCITPAAKAKLAPIAETVPTPTKLAFMNGQLGAFECLITLGGVDTDIDPEVMVPKPLPPIKAKVSPPGTRPTSSAGRLQKHSTGGPPAEDLSPEELAKLPWRNGMRKEEVIHTIQSMKLWPASIGLSTESLWATKRVGRRKPRRGRPSTAA